MKMKYRNIGNVDEVGHVCVSIAYVCMKKHMCVYEKKAVLNADIFRYFRHYKTFYRGTVFCHVGKAIKSFCSPKSER